MQDQLRIVVDAGFRDGTAGLGAWIPALGTGVALQGRASDNNEAEALAIVLGLVVGSLMRLSRCIVLTDSLVSVERLRDGRAGEGALHLVRDILAAQAVELEWRPREATGLADFFATLALEGKCLVATTPNAKNPAEKFRPLLRLERKDKTPVKDVRIKWLTLPGASKAPFDAAVYGLGTMAEGLDVVLGAKIPVAEFRVLVEEFVQRGRVS